MIYHGIIVRTVVEYNLKFSQKLSEGVMLYLRIIEPIAPNESNHTNQRLLVAHSHQSDDNTCFDG